MTHKRDPFANFDRMRLQMDELFGDALDRSLLSRRRGGFSPAVDVYYASNPDRAVVRADLAGVNPQDITLEIRGRELIISGQRRPACNSENTVYQQLEIEHGPFKRAIALGVDVDVNGDSVSAIYDDGILTIELSLVTKESSRHIVPISSPSSSERNDD